MNDELESRRGRKVRASRGDGSPWDDDRRMKGAVKHLKVMADKTRLTMLLVLGTGPRKVSDLMRDIGVTSQPAASHHLAILRYNDFVEYDRAGKENHYKLTSRGEEVLAAARGVVGC